MKDLTKEISALTVPLFDFLKILEIFSFPGFDYFNSLPLNPAR